MLMFELDFVMIVMNVGASLQSSSIGIWFKDIDK